jgi:hypothetical protein
MSVYNYHLDIIFMNDLMVHYPIFAERLGFRTPAAVHDPDYNISSILVARSQNGLLVNKFPRFCWEYDVFCFRRSINYRPTTNKPTPTHPGSNQEQISRNLLALPTI